MEDDFWSLTGDWSEQEQDHAAELGRSDIARGIDGLPYVLRDGDYMVDARTVVQLSLGWFANDGQIAALKRDAEVSHNDQLASLCEQALNGSQDALNKVTAVFEGATWGETWE